MHKTNNDLTSSSHRLCRKCFCVHWKFYILGFSHGSPSNLTGFYGRAASDEVHLWWEEVGVPSVGRTSHHPPRSQTEERREDCVSLRPKTCPVGFQKGWKVSRMRWWCWEVSMIWGMTLCVAVPILLVFVPELLSPWLRTWQYAGSPLKKICSNKKNKRNQKNTKEKKNGK